MILVNRIGTHKNVRPEKNYACGAPAALGPSGGKKSPPAALRPPATDPQKIGPAALQLPFVAIMKNFAYNICSAPTDSFRSY